MTVSTMISPESNASVDEEASALEKAAHARKARLLALKRKQMKGEHVELCESHEDQREKKTKFRNYDPSSEPLKESAVEKVAPEKLDPQLVEQTEMSKDVSVVQDIDITNLEPRKIDWDLKRDVSKKLEKLEKRTKRAMAELIRERLAQGKMDNMDIAVNMGAQAAQEDFDD